MTTYASSFYDTIRHGAQSSAEVVVARFLTSRRTPGSVIDVGGGEGWWAEQFHRRGAEVLLVEPSDVTPAVPQGQQLDLEHAELPTGFDLAVCLEVAEHLNDPTHLIAQLAAAATTVLFSGAIPGQSGHGHVSCKWQSEWAAMFAAHGFVASQTLAFKLWDDRRVEPWYRQNLLVLNREGKPSPVLDVVHPEIWAWRRG